MISWSALKMKLTLKTFHSSRKLNVVNTLLFCIILFVVFSTWYGYHIQSTNIYRINQLTNDNNQLKQDVQSLTNKLSTFTNDDETIINIKKMPKWNDEEYLLGYNHWIRGLGDTYLSNKEMNSCLFPFVPYKLSRSQGLNNDPFYNEMHECYSWTFSKIHDRTITVNCKNQKHGVYYFQNDTLFIPDHRRITDDQWIKFNKSDPKQYNKKHNQYILYLNDKTQITWIKCNWRYNYHLSLLSMKKHLPSKYEKLKSLNDKLYGKNIEKSMKPPNIVLFILDSTSRSNFMRACPNTIDYLSVLMTNKASPVKIYQFFRHSTIGWGTSINLGALLAGKVSGDQSNIDNLISLAEYYEKMGYYVPGFNEWKLNDEYRSSWQEDWAFALSKNFGNEYCWIKQRDDIELYTEFVIENINNLSPNQDKLPYFLVLHSIANHAANGAYLFNLDRYFKKLIEYIDFDNTILHILGDHGCLVGDSTTTIYGRIEVKNPISILIIPKNKTIIQKFDKYLTINQQRMVTHYDFHRFYKTIPLLFVENGEKENLIYKDLYNVNYQNIGKSLPKKNNLKLAQSILTEYISNNRSCDGIDDGFCFCDTKKLIDINYNLNKEYYEKLMFLAINTINNLTGNGNWNCIKYDPFDFEIVLYLENDDKTSIEIVIEKKHNDINEDEYKSLKKKNKWLTFVVEYKRDNNKKTLFIPIIERSKWKIPAITRIDWFKYEDCLITHYNPYHIFPSNKADIYHSNSKRNPLDGLHPVFKDYNLTRYVIASQKMWNLRVCKCV